MDLNLLDQSNYFRGLMLLIARDNKITIDEKIKIKRVAKIFNYNQEFVDSAMSDLLDNKYINNEVPEFSNIRFSEMFIRDGLKITIEDGLIDIRKIEWLKKVAIKNGLSKQWLFYEFENILENRKTYNRDPFEILKLKKS